MLISLKSTPFSELSSQTAVDDVKFAVNLSKHLIEEFRGQLKEFHTRMYFKNYSFK